MRIAPWLQRVQRRPQGALSCNPTERAAPGSRQWEITMALAELEALVAAISSARSIRLPH
jgi:hypothetical protein